MKKLLIGTSALVAAASIAGAAQAADPIKLSVGGYGAVMVGYASQDDDYTKATGREVTGVDVKGDNEIHFKGSTTLDNGLTVSVKYEIEAGGRSVNANTTIDSADEYNITVSGAFGSIVAGADDTALAAIAKTAPNVGGRIFNGGLEEGDLQDGAYVLRPAGFDNALNSAYINTGGDAETISYISPAIAGFTFGATYMPDALGGDDNPNQPSSLRGANGSNEAYGAGLMWNGTVSGVTIAAQGGYLWADAGPNTTGNANLVGGVYGAGREEWQLGGQVGYAGFTFGGGYRDVSQDLKASNGLTLAGLGARDEMNGRAWDVGLQYKTGPYGVSLAYFDSSMENAAKNVSDDTMKIWELAGEYTMGPGVALVAGVAHVDFENGTAAGATTAQKNSNENSGWVVATGLSLTF
ncbi:porin [Insolitispirillum peregrinum]|uniref:Outer membrane protein (Porin) n=1 Tax=Insolitispirillum peregrinum TaxID=80876 RepID=A0A1N7JJ66_9PROT|nr:porin [Insolitispirillum peregrinum]SIS49393.1 Outer membrane protein (porin) [Insolitispirillum peregrinum]